MRRLALVFALVSLLLSSLFGVAGEASAVKIARIEYADTPDGTTGLGDCAMGSGVVVASGDGRSLILTCRHVAGSTGDADLSVFVGGKRYRATLVAVSDSADLALISVAVALPVAKLAKDAPKIGDKLHGYGHPRAGKLKKSDGDNCDPDKTSDHDADERDPYKRPGIVGWGAIPGESGEGVFNDADELVGVLYRRYFSDAGKGGYVRFEDVKRFVEKNATIPNLVKGK